MKIWGLTRMVKSKQRGNNIEYDKLKECWIYSDTKENVGENWKHRECGHCGKVAIKDGYQAYDDCIGKLPGLMNACCGHGKEEESYVQFIDGFSINGKDAKIIQNILKKWRDSNEK